MKRNFLSAFTLISLIAAHPALAVDNVAHDHGETHVRLELNASKKWETDEALRKAMGDIRQAMVAELPRIHERRLSAKDYHALAQKVEDAVSYMVANCKLGTKADEQLHIIIAELLAGAEQMAGKVKPIDRRNGAIKVIAALNNYGKYFDDAGFVQIEH